MENGAKVYDTNVLKHQPTMPSEFVWSSSDLAGAAITKELNEPLIDLGGFMSGAAEPAGGAVAMIREACLKHGFFQVTNHGVDPALIRAAYAEIESIIGLPLETKLKARRKHGDVSGYSGFHADRYSSKLPWKETFSFEYKYDGKETQVVELFKNVFGDNLHQNTGRVYERFCEAMKKVSEVIMELLAVSLEIESSHFKEMFKDGGGIMRCNYYPACSKGSSLTMGTGPHTDPTSFTILHQDDVGGLQVFIHDEWRLVTPRPDAFVINLGDTFVALTNGKYKSCVHRALVDRERDRRSLVFFVSPRSDKIVKPPHFLFGQKVERQFPDFMWSHLYNFVQLHYRPDLATFPSFIQWLRSHNSQ